MSWADDTLVIRRIQTGDARALAEFYNGLSENSRRTFRPLGWITTLAACEDIVQANQPAEDTKYDLVALYGAWIVGWSFLWDLGSGKPTFGLGIADTHQRKGLGTRLMGRVMEIARQRRLSRVFLTVVQDNHVAWRLYEKQGFVRYGEFTGEDGLDYFRMVAEL